MFSKTRPFSRFAPKSIFSPWRSVMVRAARVALSAAKSAWVLSLKMTQFCITSMTDMPLCFAAETMHSFESCTSMSIERAKKVPLAPITSSPGLKGFSTVP